MAKAKNEEKKDLYVQVEKKDLALYDKELESLAKQMTSHKQIKNREMLYSTSSVKTMNMDV